jgi:uncharacterized membrane protein YwaF
MILYLIKKNKEVVCDMILKHHDRKQGVSELEMSIDMFIMFNISSIRLKGNNYYYYNEKPATYIITLIHE